MGEPRLPVYGRKKQKRLPENLTGKVFGKLTVMSRVTPVHSGGSVWLCRCECGKIKPIKRSGLVRGVQSCGCLRGLFMGHVLPLRPYEALYNRLRSVNETRCAVDITYEDFLSFVTEKVCHYCGAGVHWQEFIGIPMPYNLDRMNNDLGYSKDNCVVCCARCNRGKGSKFSYKEWYEMTRYFREQKNTFAPQVDKICA